MGKSTSKQNVKSSNVKHSNIGNNRNHPMAPKAGVTKTRRRYGNGGECE